MLGKKGPRWAYTSKRDLYACHMPDRDAIAPR